MNKHDLPALQRLSSSPASPALHRVDDELVLRAVAPTDAATIFATVAANRERLGAWLPWVMTSRTVADTAIFIDVARRQAADNKGEQWCLLYRGVFVGMLGQVRLSLSHRSAELGYWLDGAYEGHGIVTRACQSILAVMFADAGLHRVEISAAAGNHRSRAVPERLGFRWEGTMRGALRVNEHYHDRVVYGMLAEEYYARYGEP